VKFNHPMLPNGGTLNIMNGLSSPDKKSLSPEFRPVDISQVLQALTPEAFAALVPFYVG